MSDAPVSEFVGVLGATLVFLGLDIWSGRTHRRRTHVVCVTITIPLLTIAVLYAEEVGSYWNFPRIPLWIHLGFAYSASVAALVAVVSGLLHIRGKIRRKSHARLAWTFVALAVCAVSTGVMIFLVGEPKAI